MRNLILAFTICLTVVFTQSAYASFDATPLTPTEMKFFKKQEGHLVEASKVSGIKVSVLAAIGNIESGLGLHKRNLQGSGAAGVMGYTPRSWRYDLERHGKKVGLSKHASRYDNRANIMLTGISLKENKDFLREASGKHVTDGDVYLSHFIGLGGTLKLLKGRQNAPITRYIKIHAGNGNLYYHHGRVATVAQFRANINRKVERESKRFRTAMVIQQQKQLDRLIAGILKDQEEAKLQLAMR